MFNISADISKVIVRLRSVMRKNVIIWLIFLWTFQLGVAEDVCLIPPAVSSEFEGSIYFQFYNESNQLSYTSNSFGDNLTSGSGCNASDNLAIIVHGWLENCEEEWVQKLISSLNIHRGGCIVCMNYSSYSKSFNYFGMVLDFHNIVDILVNKLHQFVQEEFIPENIFIFGFSFGGQTALEAGRKFGKKLIGRIDVCEPAGPGFDFNLTYTKQNPLNSAKFVQCIHTSYDKGTSKRSCHQNWHMGYCGYSQIASGPYPLGSHGLCPYFYNNAFKNEFKAVRKPFLCLSTRPASNISGMAMGYVCNNLSQINGAIGYDYFADTFKNPPYHIDVNNRRN